MEKNVRECLVLFGGCKKGNKVDFNTKQKLAESYFQVQVLEVDDDLNMVTSKMFYVDEPLFDKISALNVKLLSPCYVYIKSSATSNFVSMVDFKEYSKPKENIINK